MRRITRTSPGPASANHTPGNGLRPPPRPQPPPAAPAPNEPTVQPHFNRRPTAWPFSLLSVSPALLPRPRSAPNWPRGAAAPISDHAPQVEVTSPSSEVDKNHRDRLLCRGRAGSTCLCAGSALGSWPGYEPDGFAVASFDGKRLEKACAISAWFGRRRQLWQVSRRPTRSSGRAL